jgi:hypothetical protein
MRSGFVWVSEVRFNWVGGRKSSTYQLKRPSVLGYASWSQYPGATWAAKSCSILKCTKEWRRRHRFYPCGPVHQGAAVTWGIWSKETETASSAWNCMMRDVGVWCGKLCVGIPQNFCKTARCYRKENIKGKPRSYEVPIKQVEKPPD